MPARIASLHIHRTTVSEVRDWVSAMPTRGVLDGTNLKHLEATLAEGPPGSVTCKLDLHGAECVWLHEVAAVAVQHGREALVIDGETFRSPAGFRAFTLYAPGNAPRTLWVDPVRGLAASRDELDDVLAKYVGEGHTWRDEEGEQRRWWYEPELVAVLIENGQPRWPPRFVPRAEHERQLDTHPKDDAKTRPSAELAPRTRTVAGLILLVLSAPAALIAPWFWCSLGNVSDLQGALVASLISVVSVGWLSALPFGWMPFKAKLAWFVGWPVVLPLFWGLT